MTVEGFQEKPEDRRYVSLNWVGPKYFETLGTPCWPGATSSSRTRAARAWRSSIRRWRATTSATAPPIGRRSHLRRADRSRTRSSASSAMRSIDDLHEPRRARSISTRSRRTRSDLAVCAADRRGADGGRRRGAARGARRAEDRPGGKGDDAGRSGRCVDRAGAADRHAVRRSSARSARCWRRSASTGCWPTRWRAAPTRSASAWRSARRAAT